MAPLVSHVIESHRSLPSTMRDPLCRSKSIWTLSLRRDTAGKQWMNGVHPQQVSQENIHSKHMVEFPFSADDLA